MKAGVTTVGVEAVAKKSVLPFVGIDLPSSKA
jgi:hypothetical protein